MTAQMSIKKHTDEAIVLALKSTESDTVADGAFPNICDLENHPPSIEEYYEKLECLGFGDRGSFQRRTRG